jgi:hypothetical protein
MFFAKTGVYYKIEASDVGSDCNVKIGLYQADGDTEIDAVNYNGKGEGETLNWTDCDQDGFYFIRVSFDNNDGFGEDTEYHLKIQITQAPWNLGGIVGYVYALPSYLAGKIQDVSLTCKSGDADISVFYSQEWGIFYVYGLESGDYTLTATAPGYAETEITVVVGTTTLRRDIFMNPLIDGKKRIR